MANLPVLIISLIGTKKPQLRGFDACNFLEKGAKFVHRRGLPILSRLSKTQLLNIPAERLVYQKTPLLLHFNNAVHRGVIVRPLHIAIKQNIDRSNPFSALRAALEEKRVTLKQMVLSALGWYDLPNTGSEQTNGLAGMNIFKGLQQSSLCQGARMFYVYFIKAGNKAIKIGSAKNVEKRLKMLQTGNHTLLRIIATIGFDTQSEARGYERKLHRLFSSQNIRGEWFLPVINMRKATDPLARIDLQRKHKELKKRRKYKDATS